MADALELASTEHATDFGVAPSFWAGLHLGPVVTSEVGTFKHEIVYLGDTLNTAARIEQACRTYERQFLAFADVIEALELPSDMETESLARSSFAASDPRSS